MKRLTLALGLVALAAVLAACSGASAAPATGAGSLGRPRGPGRRRRHDRRQGHQVRADGRRGPGGHAVTIDFDNQDGAPHNIAISDASGASVFKGEIVSATKVTYASRPWRPARYAVHLRGPSRHEGHDHRASDRPIRPRSSTPRPPAGASRVRRAHGVTGRVETRAARHTALAASLTRCWRSTTSRSATDRSSRSTGPRSGPIRAGSSGSSGPNGAGKTTTMRCIFGLAPAGPRRGPLEGRGRSTATRGCGSGTCPSSAACTRGCGSPSS